MRRLLSEGYKAPSFKEPVRLVKLRGIFFGIPLSSCGRRRGAKKGPICLTTLHMGVGMGQNSTGTACCLPLVPFALRWYSN